MGEGGMRGGGKGATWAQRSKKSIPSNEKPGKGKPTKEFRKGESYNIGPHDSKLSGLSSDRSRIGDHQCRAVSRLPGPCRLSETSSTHRTSKILSRHRSTERRRRRRHAHQNRDASTRYHASL